MSRRAGYPTRTETLRQTDTLADRHTGREEVQSGRHTDWTVITSNKYTGRHMCNMHAGRDVHTCRRTSRQTYRQRYESADKYTDRPVSQMFRQAARKSLSGRQIYRQAHAGRQIHRRADIQMYRHTDAQT